MNRYEPGTPRALFGVAAACLTVATLALSVAAPAALNPESREVGVLTASSETQSAFANAGAVTTSIDVVAYRTMRLVPIVQSRAQLRNGASS